MYRRGSSVPVSLALILATSAASVMAQSGRGRQLRIQQTLSGEVAPPWVAEVAEVQADRRSDPIVPAKATGETRRNSALIYNDDSSNQKRASSNQKKDSGEYHMTKGDRRAGWILLGVLVLEVVVMIANDGDF